MTKDQLIALWTAVYVTAAQHWNSVGAAREADAAVQAAIQRWGEV